MVGASVDVVFPCPVVFEGHELVYVDGVAVQQTLVFDVDAFGQIVCRGTLNGGVAAGHS